MNPYQLLGVSPGDSLEEVKKAYRKAAKECHPDTHPGDRKAEERFKELGEAYQILTNPRKMEEYEKTMDRRPGRTSRAGKPKEQGKAPKKNPIDVSDIFEQYMGFKN